MTASRSPSDAAVEPQVTRATTAAKAPASGKTPPTAAKAPPTSANAPATTSRSAPAETTAAASPTNTPAATSKSTSASAAAAAPARTPAQADEQVEVIRLTALDRRSMIATAAYYRAEGRKFASGHELEDWLAAEADVDALLRRQVGGARGSGRSA